MGALLTVSTEEREKGMVFERVRLSYARLRALATGGWLFKEGPVEVWACPFIDIFNGLISPAWPEKEVKNLWRRAVDLYLQTGQGMFVSFGPSSRAGGLQEQIQREGFRRCSSPPFMHLDLAALREHPCPDGVRVERIRDLSFFERHEHPWLGPVGAPYRKWKLQFLRGYGEGESPRLWQFLAFHQRRIVGAATIFAAGDEIAIFDVVVIRSCRQRGIGTRMVSVACAYARSLGMRAAGLSATGKGIGLYRKLGFTEAGRYPDYYLAREGLEKIAGR